MMKIWLFALIELFESENILNLEPLATVSKSGWLSD